MNLFQLQNTAAYQITVPITTASNLLSLIDAASGIANNVPGGLDALDISVEGPAIRMIGDGVNKPTQTQGLLLPAGKTHRIRGIALKNIWLVSSTGATSACSISVGSSVQGDQNSNVG
jgi:hypothetical protein